MKSIKLFQLSGIDMWIIYGFKGEQIILTGDRFAICPYSFRTKFQFKDFAIGMLCLQ